MSSEPKHHLQTYKQTLKRIVELVMAFDHQALDEYLQSIKKSQFRRTNLISTLYPKRAEGVEQIEDKALTVLTLLRHRVGINFDMAVNPYAWALGRTKYLSHEDWCALCDETVECLIEEGELQDALDLLMAGTKINPFETQASRLSMQKALQRLTDAEAEAISLSLKFALWDKEVASEGHLDALLYLRERLNQSREVCLQQLKNDEALAPVIKQVVDSRLLAINIDQVTTYCNVTINHKNNKRSI